MPFLRRRVGAEHIRREREDISLLPLRSFRVSNYAAQEVSAVS